MKPRAKLWGFVLAVNDLVYDIKATLTPLTAIINSGGFRGVSGGSLEPPPPPPPPLMGSNYFIFMEKFQKS